METTFGTIWNDETLGNFIKTVDFELDDYQDLAYYMLATNTKQGLSVTMTATTLTTALETGSFDVPYTLKVDGDGDGVEEEYIVGDLAAIGTAGTEIIPIYTSEDLTGVLAFSTLLQLKFPSLLNGTALAIPEGNYSGTVVVAITLD